MSHPPLSSHRRKSSAGFSLVEVTLAIGILSFALISIFGLLPTGLNVFRSSVDGTASAQIIQRLVGDAQMTPFANLDALNNEKFYFDDEGLSLDQSGPTAKYVAELSVSATATLPGAAVNPQLKLVTVKVSDELSKNVLRKTTTCVSDQGK